MDNLRLYNNLASYSADMTRKYPTVSYIDEGRGSIRYIKKIASNTSNLPLMNLARAANWVASDATFMTNEDAARVTVLSKSKGVMTEGYIVELNAGENIVNAVAELNNGIYTGTLTMDGFGNINMYFTSDSGNWALYGDEESNFYAIAVTGKSSAQCTVNLDGTDYSGYVYSVVTANGNKSILLVDGGDFQGIDITDSSAMSQCVFFAENSMLTYNIEYGTAEVGGGEDVSSYISNLIVFDEFKWFTSITEISSEFSYSTNLTRIIIPNSVTMISNEAFRSCTGLTTVTIGNSVTEIGDYAFYECRGLTSVTIPNSVTTIGYQAFYGCSGLTSVIIGNSVTSIGIYAFDGCTGLTSIVVENGNTEYDSRNNCNALIETATNALIYGCRNTIIPNSVATIGDYAFSDCTGLTSITIPNSVTTIGDYAFQNCTDLTSVAIGNSVTTIGSSAFSLCNNLVEVTINSNTIASKTYTSSSKISNIFGTQVTTYIIGDSVTSIGEYAFNACYGLTSVTIGNSVATIGKYAFSRCTGLTSITIPNSVTGIGQSAFDACYGLTSVTIGNSVTSIGEEAFYVCRGLTSIIVDNGNQYYDSRNNCNAIIETSTNTLILGCQNTIIPNSVTTIGYQAFRGHSGLTSVVIPNSVTSIDNNAFMLCTGLTSVTIGNSVTTIGHGVFESCESLGTITSLATTAPTIQSSTFMYIKTRGTLYYPSGSDYSAWMANGNHSLGRYNWTAVAQ